MSSEATVLAYLSHKIQEELARFADDTIAGHAKDYATYQNACGIYRGLSIANGFIVELVERIQKDDDEED